MILTSKPVPQPCPTRYQARLNLVISGWLWWRKVSAEVKVYDEGRPVYTRWISDEEMQKAP